MCGVMWCAKYDVSWLAQHQLGVLLLRSLRVGLAAVVVLGRLQAPQTLANGVIRAQTVEQQQQVAVNKQMLT